MKKLYSVLIALGVSALFASVAGAAAAKPFPNWSTQINTTKRFTVLTAFGGAAVLDNETGLVWERSPNTGTNFWSNASILCNQLNVGDRKGWRLPTLQELATLIDPAATGRPVLPAGHPFSNVQSSRYWSATGVADDSARAWWVDLDSGHVNKGLKTFPDNFWWCVRGGQGVDLQ